MVAYRIFEAIAANPELSGASGIHMRTSAFFFPYKVVDNEMQLKKFVEVYNAGVQGVRLNPKLIGGLGIDPSYGAVDAYELVVPGRCLRGQLFSFIAYLLLKHISREA